jgi:hypothetical protein
MLIDPRPICSAASSAASRAQRRGLANVTSGGQVPAFVVSEKAPKQRLGELSVSVVMRT